MILATKTYGKKTNALFSTLQEMNFALEHNPFPIKMLDKFEDEFEEPYTRVALHGGLMWAVWLKGQEMPGTLIDDIIEKVNIVKLRRESSVGVNPSASAHTGQTPPLDRQSTLSVRTPLSDREGTLSVRIRPELYERESPL